MSWLSRLFRGSSGEFSIEDVAALNAAKAARNAAAKEKAAALTSAAPKGIVTPVQKQQSSLVKARSGGLLNTDRQILANSNFSLDEFGRLDETEQQSLLQSLRAKEREAMVKSFNVTRLGR